MLIGTVAGVPLATAAVGFAGYLLGRITADSAVAQQQCYEVVVETPRDPKDEQRIAGTLIGAWVGGDVGKDAGASASPPQGAVPSGPSPATQRARSCKPTGP